MKKNILSRLLMLFTFLFLFYPASYGITDIKIIIAFLVLFILGIYIYKKTKLKDVINKINKKKYIWIILLLASITRIGIVLLLHSSVVQVSDFSTALKLSYSLQFSGDYHNVFTHWILYPTILNFIYKIFGQSHMIALLVNAVILIISSIYIYKISNIVFKNEKYALLASLVYIFWPANILYTLILTQEHLCSLILLVVFYLFFKFEQNKDFNFKTVLKYIIIGALLAFSTFFKTFAPVYIISFLIYFILKGLKEKNIKNYLWKKAILFVIILISFSASKNILFCSIDNLVGSKVARNIIPCYLNVGLRGIGTYSAEHYQEYFTTLKENNYDYEKTNEIIMKKLINDLDENLSLTFFDRKAKVLFAGDNVRLSWVNNSLSKINNNKIFIRIENIVKTLNNYYFNVLVFLMMIGLYYMNKNKDLNTFLLYLTFFGCLLLLLLVEAQNRYMYSIQTIMCILFIPGIISLYNIFKKIKY